MTAQTIIFKFKENNQSRNLFNSKKLFFDRIAMHKFVWFKEKLFWVYLNKKKLILLVWLLSSYCTGIKLHIRKINFCS